MSTEQLAQALRTGLEAAQELLEIKRKELDDDYTKTHSYWKAELEISAALAAHEAEMARFKGHVHCGECAGTGYMMSAHEAEKAQAPLKDVCPTCNGMGYLDGVGTRCGAFTSPAHAAPVAAWPEHETPAMHDAVMAVLYQGVSRTGTNALWQAYRGAMPAAPAAPASASEAPVAVPLTREQVDALMTEHYPLESLLRENVDSFEQCVRDIERTLAAHWGIKLEGGQG